MKTILGIDIGGSGIKGSPVNIKRGVLKGERYRIPTPQPSTLFHRKPYLARSLFQQKRARSN